MKVLVACEESAVVRDAWRRAGHDAWSCDLLPTRGDPRFHIQGDAREVVRAAWDLLIAHPVCRYLTNSGVRWLHEQEGRWELMRQGCEFYNVFVDADHIPMRCIENPVMHPYATKLIHQVGVLQYVQPWMFGDPYTKNTGLRLINLKKLVPTHKKSDYLKIEAKCHRMAPGPNRERDRSETYPGIANAMSAQWGGINQKVAA